MGSVAKSAKYAHPFDCGFPISTVGSQNMSDPHDTNCGNISSRLTLISLGNGISPTGTLLNPPSTNSTTSIGITSLWNYEWVLYITSLFGTSKGKRIYTLDNEPGLWSQTHRDAHPNPASYGTKWKKISLNIMIDELWSKMLTTSLDVLDADSTSLIAGPSEWGWTNFFCSAADNPQKYGCGTYSPDRAQHNGTDISVKITLYLG